MPLQFVIMYKERTGLLHNRNTTPASIKPRIPINLLFNDIPAINLRKPTFIDEKRIDIAVEMIAIVDSTFSFIRYSKLDEPIRDSIQQLQKQFAFYKALLGRC